MHSDEWYAQLIFIMNIVHVHHKSRQYKLAIIVHTVYMYMLMYCIYMYVYPAHTQVYMYNMSVVHAHNICVCNSHLHDGVLISLISLLL